MASSPAPYLLIELRGGARAGLIDGVVYLPSPVSELHTHHEDLLHCWLSHYRLAARRIAAGVDAGLAAHAG